MNISEMADALGIGEQQLKELKAQEAAEILPGGYSELELYLRSLVLENFGERWADVFGNIRKARRGVDLKTHQQRLCQVEALLATFK